MVGLIPRLGAILLALAFFYILFWLFGRIASIATQAKIITSLLVGAFFCIDIFLLIAFSGVLHKDFVEVFLQTNTAEAGEFAMFYLTPMVVLAILSFVMLSFVYLRYATIHKIASLRMTYFLLSLAIIGIGFTIGQNMTKPSYALYRANILLRSFDAIYAAIDDTNAYIKQFAALDSDLDAFLRENYDTGERGGDNPSFHAAHTYITKNTATIPNIVIIIGESTQRNYMSLYSTDALDTNPILRTIDSRNLIVFGDVISPAVHTDQSLRKVLTFSNNDNEAQIPWYKTMNLIDIFRLAGYHTTWISNQEALSIYGNAPEIIARRSDRVVFSGFGTYNLRHDGVILDLYDKLKGMDNHQKNLYVFHLMGTHQKYARRYPLAYDVFSAKDIASTWLTDKQRSVSAQYANALLYNDFIVSEIIKRFADSDSLVFYFSDHGDEVYDFRDFLGHADNMASRFMVEIPFMVYMSDGFLTRYPSIAECVQKVRNLPFMIDDFIHALLDIAGIETLDFDSTRSVFHAKYDAKHKRKVYGRDYDSEMKQVARRY